MSPIEWIDLEIDRKLYQYVVEDIQLISNIKDILLLSGRFDNLTVPFRAYVTLVNESMKPEGEYTNATSHRIEN